MIAVSIFTGKVKNISLVTRETEEQVSTIILETVITGERSIRTYKIYAYKHMALNVKKEIKNGDFVYLETIPPTEEQQYYVLTHYQIMSRKDMLE